MTTEPPDLKAILLQNASDAVKILGLNTAPEQDKILHGLKLAHAGTQILHSMEKIQDFYQVIYPQAQQIAKDATEHADSLVAALYTQRDEKNYGDYIAEGAELIADLKQQDRIGDTVQPDDLVQGLRDLDMMNNQAWIQITKSQIREKYITEFFAENTSIPQAESFALPDDRALRGAEAVNVLARHYERNEKVGTKEGIMDKLAYVPLYAPLGEYYIPAFEEKAQALYLMAATITEEAGQAALSKQLIMCAGQVPAGPIALRYSVSMFVADYVQTQYALCNTLNKQSDPDNLSPERAVTPSDAHVHAVKDMAQLAEIAVKGPRLG